MTLDQIPCGQSATITAVHWSELAPEEGLRLRALGIDEGVLVGVAHRGIFLGHDPIALTVGRMTVALRRTHAAAMEVQPAEGGTGQVAGA